MVVLKVGGEVRMLGGRSCRALERSRGALGVTGQDTFLVTLDFGLSFPQKIVTKYAEQGDDQGHQCALQITNRVNVSLSEFLSEVGQLRREKDLLTMYFSASEFLGRAKRVSSGIIFAVLMSVANLFASGANIIMSYSKMQVFENRLNVMSDHIRMLESNQYVLQDNIKMVFENSEFMGMQQNVIVDYLNELAVLHSCDMIEISLESKLASLNLYLENVLESIFSGKFTKFLVDIASLHEMTMQEYFDDSIYRISPALLYRYAKTEIVSFENGKIVLMVNYPKITLEYMYDLVNLVQAPKQIKSSHLEQFLSFLIPRGMNLSDIANNLDDIHSTDHCIVHEEFIACPDTSYESDCVKSILANNATVRNNTCLNVSPKSAQISLTYFKKGLLLKLHHGAYVRAVGNRTAILKPKVGQSVCAFVPRGKGYELVSAQGVTKLFPASRIYNFNVQPRFKIGKVQKTRPVKKLILPTKPPVELKLLPFVQAAHIDYAYLITVAVACSIGATILVMTFLFIAYRKFCTIDMGQLYTHSDS